MAIVFDSDAGTISGLSVGGLPDGVVDGDMLAANAITAGKIADGTIANADINASAAIAGSKISGGTGKVLGSEFIKQTSETAFSTTNQVTWADMSGMSITYTPKSSTSSLFLTASLTSLNVGTGQYQGSFFQLALSDNTALASTGRTGTGGSNASQGVLTVLAEYTSHTAGTAITFKGRVATYGQYSATAYAYDRNIMLLEVEAN